MPEPKPYNPWAYKPWWCQPWSIILTGSGAIAATWLLSQTVWITLAVALPVLVWMGYFLLLWPALVRQSLANSQREPNQLQNKT